MDQKSFDELVKEANKKFEDLLNCPLYNCLQPNGCLPLEIPFESGVYVFYENGKALYSGRTEHRDGKPITGLRLRIQQHIRPSSEPKIAAFPRAMAEKDKIGFDEAKKRIRKMQVRFVEVDAKENNGGLLYLSEFYISMCLKTIYNDWHTH